LIRAGSRPYRRSVGRQDPEFEERFLTSFGMMEFLEMVAVKRKRAGSLRCPPDNLRNGLQRLNVGSLQTLGAADNLEFNGLTLIERAIAVRLNRGEMDENVLAALALDETKAFAGVKPLHCSLFFHRCVPLII
jgi:hypothetical protein